MFDRQLPINTVNELLAAHGTRLRTLIGTTIDATWVGWDVARDEWFADEAVILKVGQTRLEIVCWKLDEIVLSWSGIDLGQPPRWVADWGSEFSLEWRRDGIAALQGVVGRSIVAINIVEYLYRTTTVQDRRNPANVGREHKAW